jgi:hypothetical protein
MTAAPPTRPSAGNGSAVAASPALMSQRTAGS